MAWLITCVLVGFACWAPRLPLVVKRLVRVLGVYMCISFVIRPAYLLLVQPRVAFGSRLAEPLLMTPSYWNGVEATMNLVATGFAVMLLAIYGAVYCTRLRHLRPAAGGHQLSVYWALWAISWLCRIAALTAHVDGGAGLEVAVSRMLAVGVAILGYVVIRHDWRSDRRLRAFVVTATAGEVAWAALYASKTPVVACLVFFYLDPRRPNVSWKLAFLAVCGTVGSFGVIEGLKQGFTVAASSLSTFVHATLENLLARFEMIDAVAAAYHVGVGGYMSVDAAAERLVTGWIPQQLLGIQRLSDGQQWAMVVQHAHSGVSLATGPTAEGFAIGGLAMVVVWNVIGGVAFVVVARGLVTARRAALGMVAAYVVASGGLFEQGALGLVDLVSAGLQICLVIAVIGALLRDPAVRRRPPRGYRRRIAVDAPGGIIEGRRTPCEIGR